MVVNAVRRCMEVAVGVARVWAEGVAIVMEELQASYCYSDIARHSIAAAGPDQRAQWVEAVAFQTLLLLSLLPLSVAKESYKERQRDRERERERERKRE